MEREQNIRLGRTRHVGANFDFNGNPIIQNSSGGTVRISGDVKSYSCGHQAIPGIESCSCMIYQETNLMSQKDWSASAELSRLKNVGITGPKNPVTRRIANKELLDMARTPGAMGAMGSSPLLNAGEGRSRLNNLKQGFDLEGIANTANRRTAAATGSDAQWAWPKLHDPFEYWRERTWWFNMEDPDEQTRKIRDWARLLYTTHYLVPSLIDIYTRYPLLDIELIHPDKRISDFYNDLFFDGLNYNEFLYDLGREHWTVGEAFAMGSWHDGIGAWEEDEIINPNDVIVAKNRALRTYQYHIKVPEEIKRLIERRDPPQEYAMLMQLYPDVVAWARQDKEIPVSDVIMKQIKFKCVVGSTDIMTPTGPVQARDLAVGDEVLAWDETTNKIVRSTVSHQGINEPEPIYWITTKQGRKIGVNSEHPFLTNNGWVEAADLSIGTNLLVGHSYNPEMTSNVSTDEARFFGLMVGDGSYGHKTIMFHNEDKEILNWMNEFVAGYGCKLSQAGDREISFVISQGEQTKNPNLIKKLIVDAGIRGQTTYTKRVPSCIWDGGPEVWGAFLAGYLDTDGHVDSNGMVVWTSMNRSLLEDCQTLLSFLGVESRIYDVPQYDYAPDSGYGHRLIVGKQEAKSLLSHYVQPLCLRKQVPNTTPIRNTRPSKFPYDQIVKIEMGIDEETMAIGIAEHHTHITAGLVTHNTNPWSEHGTPILLRAFRMLMLEESLNAAQDAIADRLYSPLILATLGLPDVDQDGPWVPDAQELQSLRDDLAMAINSDFRLMTYHHGLTIQNAFGRESMPRLDQDFMRVESKVMQVFGIGADLLQGGNGGTYAAGALNRELITQMLSTYQHKIESFIRSRMEPVAERQGHYEMRNVGGQMVPIMETVLMVDEETGAEYVEERPKLAIPEVRFRSMNLRDETVERGFLQQLMASGFPISLSTLAVNIPIDFDDEIEARKDEKIKTVVAEQQYKKELFNRLMTLQLPIPPEYVQEYQAYLAMLENPALGAQLAPGAMQSLIVPPAAPNLTGEAIGNSDAAAGAQVYPSVNNMAQQMQQTQRGTERQRPQESYEQRKNAPKPSKKGPKNGPKKKTASVASWDEDYDDTPFETITYGDRMKFAVPFESKKRKRMKLARGMKIVADDSYEKFNEEEFKKHLSSIMDEPMIQEPTNLEEHSSGDGGMDQPARKQIDPTKEDV